MTHAADATETTNQLCHVRQVRQYTSEPIDNETLDNLIQIARWTGSSRNTQPWHFVVVNDREQLEKISQLRTPINWVASAPVAIAIVLDGHSDISEAYDEGRVTERLLIGAHMLGLGGGTAWFGNADQEAEAARILNIPEGRTARSVVVLGHPITSKDPRPNPAQGGRRPLSELVSHNRMG